ncbi:MAG: V-type ATP synthase subunit E [Nitrososphaerota archaeon]|nr:V-type ATP synthase subunit E [Nitrososphaerota archaeon]
MGAEALLRAVEEKRVRTLGLIEAEHEARKREIAEAARKKVAEIAEAAGREAAALSRKEAERVLGAAKLQAKQKVFDATEQMLEQNMAEVRGVLSEISASASYKSLLKRMVRYAQGRLGKGMRVRCRREDKPFFAAQAQKVKVDTADLKCIGGFVASDEAGTLELDLRFEELLRLNEEKIRTAIWGKE